MGNENIYEVIARVAEGIEQERGAFAAMSFANSAWKSHVDLAFGWEVVEIGGVEIEYLNVGDTYSTTIVRDADGRYYVSCVGDEIESIENERVAFEGPKGFGFSITVGDALRLREAGPVDAAADEIADSLLGRSVVESQRETMIDALSETGGWEPDELEADDMGALLSKVLFAFCPDVREGEREALIGI